MGYSDISKENIIVKAHIMDEATLNRTLTRISHEILEKNKGAQDICIIGILRRGNAIAEIIRDKIQAIEGIDIPCGSVNVKFYSNDLSKVSDSPIVKEANIGFDISKKNVILVDDVIYTGRTVRAAIDTIFTIGNPKSIQLVVLMDRGHRELPIRPDFIGKNIPTSKNEVVNVMMPPYDDSIGVDLCEQI